MTAPPSRSLRFDLERWVQRGVTGQLVLMAVLVVLVAVLGGLAAWLGTTQFASAFDAVWWAFLRLTDPGYLGDDEGAYLRVVSTVVTVLGYVLFMGSLIAIMTQWLARTIRTLESGVTPIAMRNHFVILGWTNRTAEIVHKLLSARGRLKRFLARHDASRLNIVILCDTVDAERRQELRDHLKELWDERRILLRSGSSLQPEHLERLDLLRAAVVVVPGADFELGGSELTDTRIVKTLLTLDRLLEDRASGERPHVVAEIFDPLKVPIARATVRRDLEVIASDGLVSRVIAQSVRHRRMAQVYLQILSHREGASLYVRGFDALAGASAASLDALFPTAVVLGVVRAEPGGLEPHLNPGADFELAAGDLLVLLAPSYEACEPLAGATPEAPLALAPTRVRARAERSQRLLILGWSYKIGAIVTELDGCAAELFEVTVMSRVPIADRVRWLGRVDFDREHVRVEHVEGDYSLRRDLSAREPAGYDDVLFLASAWMSSSEEADARTILGWVLLKDMLAGANEPPDVLVELLDPENSRLFPPSRDLILISPRLLSHLLAHVALRPELNPVFDALFGAGGNEIELRRADVYDLAGRALDFAAVQAAARARGDVALGLLLARGGPRRLDLAPARSAGYELQPQDEVVVLAEYRG